MSSESMLIGRADLLFWRRLKRLREACLEFYTTTIGPGNDFQQMTIRIHYCPEIFVNSTLSD
jgi:hypothetical protein